MSERFIALQLDNTQRQALRDALLSGYRRAESLRIFVDDNFPTIRLNEVATSQAGRTAADDLITAFEETGEIFVLIAALYKERPNNPEVLALFQVLPADVQQQLHAQNIVLVEPANDERLVQADDLGSSSVVVKEPVSRDPLTEPENSAHLVVTVFWKGEKNLKQFRVSPKLCYFDSQNSQIVHTPLAKEEDIDTKTVPQNCFSDFLKGLHTFALRKLRNSVADRPWKLSIELFLPLDLLCLPLSTWCGKDDTLISKHSIVIGCSDRFDEDRPDDAINLYNQLELQWQRFLATVPDQAGSSLQDLDWLDSTQLATGSLAACQGFRCLGGWLIPGEWNHLDATIKRNWKELIGFGVPLALWICQGDLAVSGRRQVFNSLAQGTRFDLLDKIPIERNIGHRSGQCVGVLYEDLNYAPERPKLPEQRLFSWPGF